MKLSIPLYYFSFIFFLLYSNVCAQNSVSNSNADSKFYFERFSTEDGMPSRFVVSIAQDHDGFIWLGTFDGLVKYDGYEFQIFRNIPGDSKSLSDNSIEALYVDFTGDLWVGTKSGLNRYEPSTKCFFRYISDSTNIYSITSGQVNTFIEDHSKNLWIGTQQGGLFRYERESDSFTRFLCDPADSNNLLEDQVRVLLADRKNHLWIGTGEPFDPAVNGGGLIRFNLLTGAVKRFKHIPQNQNSLIDDRVSALLEDNNGVLWVGTGQSGLHFYDPEEEEFVRMMHDTGNPDRLHAPLGDMGLLSSNPHIRILHQDKEGAFWIGTYNGGINHFNSVTKKLTHYMHEPGNQKSLANNMIFTLFEDRQDRLWIGSILGGLQKIEPSLHKFIIHNYDLDDPTSLSSNNIKGIYEAPKEQGIIWLSTSGGGLNRLDLNTGTATAFRHNANDKSSIGSDNVWTTFEDQTGALWVGTEQGLDLLDRKTGKFSHFKLNSPGNEISISTTVLCLYEDLENFLWIGTWSSGVFRFDRNKGIFKQYNFSNGYHQTNFNSVYLLHEDAEGTLWLGTWLGALYKYDRQKDTFNPKLQGFGAICLQEDDSGWFWIGTEKDGLLHYDPRSDSVKIYTIADGLPSNNIYSILEDNLGFYWISTENGISKFDPYLKTFSNYDISDGLPVNSFNLISSHKGSNGQLFLGGNGGLVSFFPDQVKGNPYPPDVVLSGLHITGEPFDFLNTSSEPSEAILLNHNQNDLTFDYVGLHYTEPSKNQYRYMLEPYDPDWIAAGTQRTARYTNLNPGEYTFRVKASNSDGVWNEKGASIKILIASPWWQTNLAYFVYIILALSMFYSIRRYELNRQKLKYNLKLGHVEAEKLKEVDQIKSRFFANVSHEFRTPLTLIFGPAKDIVEKAKDGDIKRNARVIKRNADKLYRLVNQLLELSKLEAGGMTLGASEQNIIPLMKGLFLSFSSIAERKKITLQFNSSEDELMVYTDNDKIEKIITNLLSNAFKFTNEGGRIIFSVKKLIKEVEIKISDNGIGIPKERFDNIFDRFFQVDGSHTRENEGTGIGLALTKELVELHKGKIKVESIEGKGTTFVVSIPLGKEHLNSEEIVEKEIREETTNTIEETEFISDREKSKVKDDIDLLLETDLSAGKTGKPELLIVEDNLDVRNYIIRHLEEDYKIHEAVNGEDGYNKSIEQIPDLIVSDVMMPQMDGFQLCAKIKTDERTSHIPVILLTAKASGESRIEGLETGADDYIMKPFDAKELKVRIKNLIDQRKKLRKHFLREGIFNLDNKNLISTDKKFLEKAVKIINEHLSDSLFGVDLFARELSVGRTTLHKKILALVGVPPSELIKRIRLSKAGILLKNKTGNISEIALYVGFNNPAYFSECFKKQFGISPFQYQRNF